MKTHSKTSFPFSFILALSILILCSTSCHHQDRVVKPSFYYWKTVYKSNKTEQAYLRKFKTQKLYVRIMDVDTDETSANPVPISPVTFQAKLPETVDIVPVVFIANNILKKTTHPQIDNLAAKISNFVDGKIHQAGKYTFDEIQIDCDWTASTRENYFYLLTKLEEQPYLKSRTFSATLRLHQIKNQKGSGIPPVGRGMLMCYNMGNLRKYGQQNSILEIAELKKYINHNITGYPLPLDVGLPLFSWAVAFRNHEYIGIAKRISIDKLHNKNQFIYIGNNIYRAKTDLPDDGLKANDEVRWEAASAQDLQATAAYLSPLLKTDTLNIIYFHLDELVLKAYTYDIDKTDQIFR